MLRTISILVLLLGTSFADTSLLVDQLFWDPLLAYDYASRLASHPEIPVFRTSEELGLDGDAKVKYTALHESLIQLRHVRSETVLLSKEVQLNAIKMQRKIPFIVNLVLGVFGKGFRNQLMDLVTTESDLKLLHSTVFNHDLFSILNDLESSEKLSEFSSYVALPNGVTYMDLQLRAANERAVSNYSPFLVLPFPREPACSFSTVEGEITIPKYVADDSFSQITSMCVPNTFYEKDQLEEVLFIWGPHWNDFNRRLNLLEDLGNYITIVSDETGKTELIAMEKLQLAQSLVTQLDSLSNTLNDSSVSNAILQISSSSQLSADTTSFDFSGASIAYEGMLTDFLLARESLSLGDQFTNYQRVVSTYGYLNSLVSSSLFQINRYITIMEDLCLQYNSFCSFEGTPSERLLETAQHFIEVRANYLEDGGRLDEAYNLKLTLIKSKLTIIETTLFKIEEYVSPTQIINYKDELIGFQKRIMLNSKTPVSSTILELLLFDIQNFQEQISGEFFKEFRNDALRIKSELLSLSQSLQKLGEVILVENREISIFSNPIEDILYYLSRQELVSDLKLKYSQILGDLSSNIPSNSICSPKLPVLGEPFQVNCITLINNTWGVSLDSASSVLSLPYLPSHLDSQNFAGDVSHLKSVSFSEGTTRLNLKDVSGPLFFNITYSSYFNPARTTCSFTSIDISADFECIFSAECSTEKAYVTLLHPFSGRKMISEAEYYFNGSHIFVEIPCNKVYNTVFSGPSIEVVDGTDSITNLINDTVDFTLNTHLSDTNQTISIGVSLEPFESQKLQLPSTILEDVPSDEISNPTSILNESQLLGYSSYRDAARNIFSNAMYSEFGCVEKNIITKVKKSYNFPTPSCMQLTQLQDAKSLFERDEFEAAVKKYLEIRDTSGLEVFLAKSLQYKDRAEQMIGRLNSLNALSSRLASPYVEKAQLAYDNQDYITSLYYSHYAFLKSTINLGIDFRVVVAIAIIAYGIYSNKNKKEEELL
ncbi:MAG: hypothetical protein GOV01_02230 [Candidatus Altiarchaeota archaeon]|nr:hypothetical protein [Candidatus Altiarchaeota archaeon]